MRVRRRRRSCCSRTERGLSLQAASMERPGTCYCYHDTPPRRRKRRRPRVLDGGEGRFISR